MEWIFIILGIFYGSVIIYFLAGLYRDSSEAREMLYSVSVLVPARNEEHTIAECLNSLKNQSYPHDKYQVFVIDDQSTDHTAAIVEELIQDLPNFHLIRHCNDELKATFKKEALKYALQQVSSELVMTIDADSVAQQDWIASMVQHYDSRTGLVAGLVTFPKNSEKSLFHKLQTLEFAGIVLCGAGSAGNHHPIICNGSNLSYRLAAFRESGGYDGHLFLPSGDDDLLMQNIHRKTGWKIKYSLQPQSITFTRPVDSWPDFINQRARWASKSLYYPKKWVFVLMFSIYIFYLLLLILFPFVLTGQFPVRLYLAGLALKIIPEFLLIRKALSILRRRDLLKYFPLAQPLQIGYTLIVGVLGMLNRFTWKGGER